MKKYYNKPNFSLNTKDIEGAYHKERQIREVDINKITNPVIKEKLNDINYCKRNKNPNTNDNIFGVMYDNNYEYNHIAQKNKEFMTINNYSDKLKESKIIKDSIDIYSKKIDEGDLNNFYGIPNSSNNKNIKKFNDPYNIVTGNKQYIDGKEFDTNKTSKIDQDLYKKYEDNIRDNIRNNRNKMSTNFINQNIANEYITTSNMYGNKCNY